MPARPAALDALRAKIAKLERTSFSKAGLPKAGTKGEPLAQIAPDAFAPHPFARPLSPDPASRDLVSRPVAPLGVAPIDACLPGGGLALDALHEVLPETPQDHAAATGFVLALLGRILAASDRPGAPILWIDLAHERVERGRLYGPGLHAAGLDPRRFIFVSVAKQEEALHALEDGLRANALAAAVAAVPDPAFTPARRLALAAAQGATPALVLAHAARAGATPALSRWRVGSAPSAPDPFDPLAPGAPRWRVGLERTRTGGAGLWTLERDHDLDPARPRPLRLAAPMADRPARQNPIRRAPERRAAS